MRDHSIPNGLCSIDPMSAVLGGVLPALFGGGGAKAEAPPAPEAPPPQAPPPQKPQGNPKQSNSGSSFIGGIPTPPQSTGTKTLLGQ
jgi:hypothetical protein